MLFDLRGSGRRTTVKAVYLTLAILMGGGLVLFGIGGDVSGGLVDALTSNDGSVSSSDSTFRDRAEQAQREAAANPQDPAAWADLARARFQYAGTGDFFDRTTATFTAEGKAQLTAAAAAWEKHLELAKDKPDDRVATLMVQAYSQAGLNDPEKAVAAQEIITEVRPKDSTFATLALLSYEAGQTRKGDLATKEALRLADKDDRNTLKAELQQAKQQALASQIQQSPEAPTPSPEAD
jgi:tetratricopeptide (TPR) repeat protein